MTDGREESSAPPPDTLNAVAGVKRPREDTSKALSAVPRSYSGRVHLGLCLCYVGTAYRGLQIQTALTLNDTVEGVLLQALHRIRPPLVRSIEGGRAAKDVRFLRACRTDKGVHAIRNLVTLLVPQSAIPSAPTEQPPQAETEPGEAGACEGVQPSSAATWDHVADALCASINSFLPATLRCVMATPLCWDFVPRKMCTRRVYRYLLPTFALDASTNLFAEAPLPSPSLDCVRAAIARVNTALLPKLLGTHRFHNFTADGGPSDCGLGSRVKANTNEALRHIRHAELLEDLVHVGEGGATRDYVVFQIEGASFLLNMIRKIVGVLLAVLWGARDSIIDDALDPNKLVSTPLAPAQYLYLYTSFYDSYDAAHETKHGRFVSLRSSWERHQTAFDQFEKGVIVPEIAAIDASQRLMVSFLKQFRVHIWNIRTNPFGIIEKKKSVPKPVGDSTQEKNSKCMAGGSDGLADEVEEENLLPVGDE